MIRPAYDDKLWETIDEELSLLGNTISVDQRRQIIASVRDRFVRDFPSVSMPDSDREPRGDESVCEPAPPSGEPVRWFGQADCA